EVNRASAGGGVAAGGAHVIELSVPRSRNADSRPDGITVAFRAFQLEFEPVIAARAVIHPDLRWCAERRHDHVKPAVVIEVPQRRAAVAPRRLGGKARLLRQCGPSPMA